MSKLGPERGEVRPQIHESIQNGQPHCQRPFSCSRQIFIFCTSVMQNSSVYLATQQIPQKQAKHEHLRSNVTTSIFHPQLSSISINCAAYFAILVHRTGGAHTFLALVNASFFQSHSTHCQEMDDYHHNRYTQPSGDKTQSSVKNHLRYLHHLPNRTNLSPPLMSMLHQRCPFHKVIRHVCHGTRDPNEL